MKFLQSSWVISLVGCITYLTTTAAVLSSAKFESAASSAEEESHGLEPGDDPSWKFRNPEFEQWVQDLRQENAALAVRKTQLSEWETRLQAERQELSTVTQKVAQLQAEFDKNVVRMKDQEVKNLKRQAKTVGDLTPESATAMLDHMTDDDIVRLFCVMKSDQVTLLLETLGKQGKILRAAAITKRMGYLLPDADSANSQTTTP